MGMALPVLFVVAWFIVVPIYLLVRVSSLGRTLQEIKDQLSALKREPRMAGPAAEAPPAAPDRIATAAAPSEIPPTVVPAPAPPAKLPPTAGLEQVTFPRVEVPPPPAPPVPPTITPPAPGVSDWESLLGANWLSKLGVAALAIAAAFFLKYAFDQQWIGPTARIAIGLVSAAILVGLGQYLLMKPRYRTYAQVLMSGGIIIYFLSVFAAFSFYHRIGWSGAFAALALGALAASALATVDNAEAVATLCLLGAFATPLLLQQDGVGSSDLAKLYVYLTGLNVWSAILVRARRWNGLMMLSFGATWIVFYGSDPGRPPNPLLFEAFALVFLLFGCYGGLVGMAREAKPSPEMANAAVAIIIIGCLAFAVISVPILGACILWGLPALALAGGVLALVLLGLMYAIPEMPSGDRAVRQAFGYLGAATLAIMFAVAVAQAARVPATQVPIAFGFALVSYLLFLGLAVVLQRQDGYEGPAMALMLANGLGHIAASFHVLAAVRLWGMPAAPLWLPVAGWLMLLSAFAAARREDRQGYPLAAAFGALAFPLVALVPLFVSAHYRGAVPAAAALFAAEFVVISATSLAARRRLATPHFRGDLATAFGAAAIFFLLLAQTLRMIEWQGLVVLCGCALAFAAYHAVVGALILRPPKDDALLRLTYLGMAVTFVTIAIPLQLRASSLTVAWAAESVVLIWTGIRVRDDRVRAYGYALLLLAAWKSLMWDVGRVDHPEPFLLNLRMLSGGSIIAASALSARLLARAREVLIGSERWMIAGLMGLANFFALLFVSVDLWRHLEAAVPTAGRTSAQQLSLSIFWSIYALALMSVGIWRRARPVRLLALALLFVSILKVFIFDLSALQQPYRIVSFFGLGLILLVVSLLYTRFEERLK